MNQTRFRSDSNFALDGPEFSYHMLRNALDSFGKNLSQLDADEFRQVQSRASKSYRIESTVLASPEARGVLIAPSELDASVETVKGRYANETEFENDLVSNGLDQEGLQRALYRELLFNNILQRVAARAADVSELDMRLFYELNLERFSSLEKRAARHILITVNADFAENSADRARQRSEEVEAKLDGRTNRFHDFAKRYSECPSAMEGGKLGDVTAGQLYPELDAVLFKLEENQISSIVESELGFHLLWCEKIKPAKKTPYSKALPRIKAHLEERQRRNCQKTWIASLTKIADH